MKIVIAGISHETNSFSPVPTPLANFGPVDGPVFGKEALDTYRGTGTSMAAFIDAAEREGAEIVTPISARCRPSAPVDDDAYRVLSDTIVEAVAAGCDGVLLDLHGAMVVQSLEDGEGYLLERLRRIAPDVPIGVAYDLHANVSARMVENATVCVGYKTYPHVDIVETGEHAARLFFAAMRGEIRPVMRWGNAPMLPHTLRMDTGEEPFHSLIEMAKAAERRPGILAVSVFGGFPLADTTDAGLSCIVVADGDAAAAAAVRDEILSAAWQRREQFVYHGEPLEQSIARARGIDKGPVLLIDHADNCNSGGTLDSMTVIAEAMRQGLTDVAVAPVCDPFVARQLHEAGVGAEVIVELGGKWKTPALTEQGKPLRLNGRVTAVSDGKLIVEGPVFTGTPLNMGPSAVLDTGDFAIVITSRRIEPYDFGIFRSLGIEPTQKRYLLLKSRIQYKPTFVPIATAVIECDGTGVASSDYSLFNFQRVRRPIYPIDSDARFPLS